MGAGATSDAGAVGEAVEATISALTASQVDGDWCNRAAPDSARVALAIGGRSPSSPTSPVHLNIANVLVQLGRHQDALASFQAALSIRPDAIAAALGKGAVLVSLARHEEALNSFEAVLSLDSENIEALNGRGFVLKLLNRHAEALSAYDRLLGARPDHVDALNNRGNALCALDRYEEGLASYDRALEWAPNNVDALANRGYALNVRRPPVPRGCDRALPFGRIRAALNHRGIA